MEYISIATIITTANKTYYLHSFCASFSKEKKAFNIFCMAYNKVKKGKKNRTPFLVQNWYLSMKVLEKNNFSEAQGRNWRFRSFARLYIIEKYQIIVTGHTATDQSETALLQLIRGTSFSGMTRFRLSKQYKRIFPKYPNYSIFF